MLQRRLAAAIDFESETVSTNDAMSGYLPLNNTPQVALMLDVDVMTNASKPIFVGFGLEFYGSGRPSGGKWSKIFIAKWPI